MAVHSYEEARRVWRKDLNVKVLRPEVELFFELSLGSVYESSGQDLIALSCYVRAMRSNLSKENRLPYNHPDEAFPYVGMGSVFFYMDEPAWALRCYLKARSIREERLGGDTVDTATVYNNLGCCYQMLERNQEALAFLELANAIYECELGS
jgi:tetratricopeptide (TPR) repeat protein